jgi:DNA-binding NtrC family response regulator
MPAAGGESTSLPARPVDLRGLSILVVEDEFLVSLDLEAMLRELGGEVIGPFARLDRATAAARAEPLHVALLDVNVGGQLVTPVADALAERAIPFVFCTGYDAASLPAPHAAVPILMKPCQAHQLKDSLLAALAGPRQPAPPGSGKSAGGRASPKTGGGRARRADRRPED